jgi:hypothetical protein
MHDVRQPRLAATGPILRGGGELHIVGNDDVTSIADPHGALHRLVLLADGSRSTSELCSALVAEYPQLDEQDVARAVSELTSTGVLEDWAQHRRTRRAR